MLKKCLTQITVFSPAKINIFLAVTGKRGDGFHELVSLAAPLNFGDTLWLTLLENENGDRLECDNPDIPTGEENLILRAAAEFRKMRKLDFAAHFHLQKRIPAGAGLGGGSSNAAAALRALNLLAKEPLSAEELAAAAANVGADCPLFLHNGPVIIRGRGERVELPPKSVAERLAGLPVIVFKPEFSIDTGWAYGELDKRNSVSSGIAAEAEAKFANWLRNPDSIEDIAFNSFEQVIFDKFIALKSLREEIKREFGLNCHLSGSGSACFFLGQGVDGKPLLGNYIIERLGAETFFVKTHLV